MTPKFIKKTVVQCLEKEAWNSNETFGVLINRHIQKKDKLRLTIKKKSDLMFTNYRLYQQYCSLYKGIEEGIELIMTIEQEKRHVGAEQK